MMSTTKLGKALVVCLFLNFFLTIAIGWIVLVEHVKTRQTIIEANAGQACELQESTGPSLAHELQNIF